MEQADLKKALQDAERLLSQGALNDAEVLYRNVLEKIPGQADASQGLGLIALHTGHASAAVELLQMAVIGLPKDARVYTNLGLAFATAGDAASAESCYLKSIQIAEKFVDPHLNLANLLLETGRTEEAADAYAEATRLAPNSGAVHYGRSMLELRQGRRVAAIAALRQAIDHAPSLLPARINLANLLYSDGEHAEAVIILEEAVHQAPHSFDARLNLCALLQQTNRTAEAVKMARDALSYAPESPELLLNLSSAETADGQPEEAWRTLDRALGIAPDYAPAKLNRAMVRLLLEDIPGAWVDFEARPSRGMPPHPDIQKIPEWNGEKLSGKTLIVWAEQGYGDTIQFARFLPRLKDYGASLLLIIPEALAPVFQNFTAVDGLIIQNNDLKLPAADFQVPMLSLMYHLNISLNDIVNTKSNLNFISRTSHPFGNEKLPVLGLCWQGSEQNPNDHRRSIPLSELLDRISNLELTFIGLQHGSTEVPIANPAANVSDFGETAALILACDLVISVDTSVAHLSGALGKPVWTLLPYSPDWRWGLGRKTTPWYQTMRLFRQPAPGDWDSVFGDISEALRNHSFN